MKKREILKRAAAVSLCAAMTFSMTACNENTPSDSQGILKPVSSDENSMESSSEPAQSAPESTAADSDSTGESTDASIPEDTPFSLGDKPTPAMIARSRYNVGNQVRLAKVIKKMQAGEDVTVAYIGGSITQGTSAGGDLCYARLTTNWLQEQFPDAAINYVNAGIGATGSYFGVHRADKDVLSHEPDLVFVEFSVNDTTERTEINKEAYAGLLRKLWAGSKSPAIITIAMTQEDGTSFQEYHGEIAKIFDIPMISYKNVILDIIDKGYITWDDISGDDIHPNVAGHALLSDLITNYLQSVIDNVDSISGEESDFSVEPELGAKYTNVKLLTSEDIEPTSIGCFEVMESQFGGFQKPWFFKRKDGEFTDADAIEFEFEGTNIGIMYGKLTRYSTKADIYIDGELIMTLDPAFPDGWGSYVEFAELATGLSEGKHTLKVAPKPQEGSSYFYLSGITLS